MFLAALFDFGIYITLILFFITIVCKILTALIVYSAFCLLKQKDETYSNFKNRWLE